MAAAGGSIVSIGLPGLFIKLSDMDNRALAMELRPDGRPRIPPGQHAVKKLADMGGVKGDTDINTWRLNLKGEVDQPTSMTYADVMGLKRFHLVCDVHCVTGWTLLDASWVGVPLKTILSHAKIKKNAAFVIFEAPGGYSSSIPLEEAQKDNVIMAHDFNNTSLSPAHGAPLRALVPDRYFYKSVKWVHTIRVTQEDEPGYYESGGFSNSADPWREERYNE